MSHIENLAQFVVALEFNSIPIRVLDYTKIVIMDTLVCGLAAAKLPRSEINRRVAMELGGGVPHATVFGSRKKVSVTSAVYANAEMMNALDADDTFFNTAHFAAIVGAVALAESERHQRTGREFLMAFLAGFEVNARLNLASKLIDYDGEQFRWSPLVGTGTDSFGAAVTAACLNKQNIQQIRNAMGIVGWTAPAPKAANMATRKQFNSFKYAPYGCVAQTGVMAAALAQEGYIGELDVLDTKPGFFEAQGYRGAYEEFLDCSENRWWILETALKPFPSCRYTHAAIDAILAYQRERKISLNDIQQIEIMLNPIAYSTLFFKHPQPSISTDHLAPLHGAFNIPYVISLALLGYRRGPGWYMPEALNDATVWELAGRITTLPDPELEREWREAILNDPIHRPVVNRAKIVISTSGGKEVICSSLNQGDPWSAETRADWLWMHDKMHDFLEGVMPVVQQDKLFESIRSLESVENVREEISPMIEVMT